MLKGINPLVGPDLLQALAAMGHGDQIVIADRNFPSHRIGQRVVEMRGHDAPTVVAVICELLPLDLSVRQPVLRMKTDDGDLPEVHVEVMDVVAPILRGDQSIGEVERFDFYDRAGQAYLVVVTGESRPYGDFILTKGVI
ncbi:MAG: RbsD/FucU domain-containing protein [Scrofimicrobium sp.]